MVDVGAGIVESDQSQIRHTHFEAQRPLSQVAQLDRGDEMCSFALAKEHFPDNFGETSVRKVMHLARDRSGRPVPGLELHVAHGNDLDVDLVTLANGMTENLRPGALFTPQLANALSSPWKISAADRLAAGKVHDLFVFFWYEYDEREVVLT